MGCWAGGEKGEIAFYHYFSVSKFYLQVCLWLNFLKMFNVINSLFLYIYLFHLCTIFVIFSVYSFQKHVFIYVYYLTRSFVLKYFFLCIYHIQKCIFMYLQIFSEVLCLEMLNHLITTWDWSKILYKLWIKISQNSIIF